MRRSWSRLTAIAALAIGVSLLVVMLRRVDAESISQLSRLFGLALPLLLLPGAAWHLLRTEAWRRCFPADRHLRFATAFRVRLSAEAFSYVTIAGVTGEPIKVVLLTPSVPPAVTAAAIAVERAAYTIVTAAIVGISAGVTATTVSLPPRWMHIYAWIAAVATLIVIVPIWLVARSGTGGDQPRGATPVQPQSRARRFLRDFARQFRALATSDRRSLALVMALDAAAFLMMALEVFAALSLTGTSVTFLAAMAIETFTRVASIVSAFIPGNLGALEISNLAAATALHAAGGGIALALVRRLRGLVWCTAGFLVYPRNVPRRDSPAETRKSPTPGGPDTLVTLQRGDSDARVTAPLGGMPVGERIARAARRAGYTRLLVWTGRGREADWRLAVTRLGSSIDVVATGDREQWRRQLSAVDPRAPITVLAPGIVASPQLLSSARDVVPDRDRRLLEAPAGTGYRQSGVCRATAGTLLEPDRFASRLIGAEPPPPSGDKVAGGAACLVLRVESGDDIADAEAALRASIFKPTDGTLGRFNRRLSIPISVALIRATRLSAHAMSVVVIGLGLYAGWLFSVGSYRSGVAAAIISWAASVLDGCDGELARLQYKESALGCWVDTLGDYVYYLAVFAGLTVGAVRQTGSPAFWWCGAVLCAGVLLTFLLLILLRWRITGGRPERLRSRTKDHFYGTGKLWARVVAKLSTCATRATMPYGIVAFAIVGLLPVVVVLATIGAQVYWISLAREFRRLVNDATPADDPLAVNTETPTPTPSTA
jgi:phosphatidylglycerophosphate synthase